MSGSQRMIAGRYRLLRPIAEGGFGRVWRAHDALLDAHVVVKEVLLPSAARPGEHAKRLAYAEREARNAVRLRHHPGIVPVYDVAVEDGRPWIVMQLVEGGSLEDRLHKGPLSVAQTVELADVLLKALGAAQQVDVVHRDVKPANIMLATDGRIMLTDFGIAAHPADTRLTTDGSVIGSLEYMAPERLGGSPGTHAGDLFSLGATLYHAVEGVSPFRRDSHTATLAAVAREAPSPPVLAGRLTPLLRELLAKDPRARPTVTEALDLLHAPRARKRRRTVPRDEEKTSPQGPAVEREEQPAHAFTVSWTGDESPWSFCTHKTTTVWNQWVYHLVLFAVFMTAAYLWGQGMRSAAGLELMFGAVFGYQFTTWFMARTLKKQMAPRSLRVDKDGITTTDPFSTQHIPWAATTLARVHSTEASDGYAILALHLRLSEPTAGAPPSVLYRPAGWPGGIPVPEVSRGSEPPGQDDWVPVCVLGPLPEPRRIDLRNAVATHMKRPLEAEEGW
ncbi:serine/threonine protein kinase [Streptomyces sp. NBC_00727]|uniref:serine/threonine-protein kinase n=1 Tax=Streptomyces sp. NBC_00727 TaxID=2903675 RepID=UPI00386A77CD